MPSEPVPGDHLANHALEHPEKLFCASVKKQSSGESSIEECTWSQFINMRNRLCSSLVKAGMKMGDRAIVYGHNSLQWILVREALLVLGIDVCPLNWHLVNKEVSYILGYSKPVAVFVDDEFDEITAFCRKQSGCAHIKHWINMGPKTGPCDITVGALVDLGLNEYPDFKGRGGYMLFTGGTSGLPKGVNHRGSRAVNMMEVMSKLRMIPNDDDEDEDDADADADADFEGVHLISGPLYHAAPFSMALTTCTTGQTSVVLHKFDAEVAMMLIAKYRVTSAFMAPVLIKRILAKIDEVGKGKYDLSSLKALVSGGAPLPDPTKVEINQKIGNVACEFYGASEMGIVSVLEPKDALRKPGSCGKFLDGIEYLVVDEKGNNLPPNTPGELYVKHGGIMAGYHDDEEKTKKATIGDGFVGVGDIAKVDEEGFLYICDRKTDMILSGGVNVYPAEIENCLHDHPLIKDVAVYGVPDAEFGEKVHAAIQLKDASSKLLLADVQSFCKGKIAGYKLPRSLSLHKEFPRDNAGKIKKRLLRDNSWQKAKM